MRPALVYAAGGAVVVLLLLAGGVLLFRDSGEDYDSSLSRYTDRELLMPGAEYRFPDVEQELLTPQVHSLVDPDKPLSREQADALRIDTVEALATELTPRVEAELEELLFE
jgi:hypothetical protein